MPRSNLCSLGHHSLLSYLHFSCDKLQSLLLKKFHGTMDITTISFRKCEYAQRNKWKPLFCICQTRELSVCILISFTLHWKTKSAISMKKTAKSAWHNSLICGSWHINTEGWIIFLLPTLWYFQWRKYWDLHLFWCLLARPGMRQPTNHMPLGQFCTLHTRSPTAFCTVSRHMPAAKPLNWL